MINRSKLKIDKLSSHLFWDVDRGKIDPDRSMNFFINGVLEYGLINDWEVIYAHYGINQIADVAMRFKDPDDKTMSFIAMLAKKPLKQFKCYSTRQSKPKHWNF